MASRNRYIMRDGYAVLTATNNGMEILVSPEDLECVLAFGPWRARKDYNTFYALTYKGRTWIRMHRFILAPDAKLVVDHINHNGLDNRRSNIRVVTNQQNLLNRSAFGIGQSGYRGVARNRNKWVASVMVNYRRIVIGAYETPEAASVARNNYVSSL
jgi:hypothetical protein